MFLSPSVVTDQDRVKEFNFKLMCYFSLPEDVSKGKKKCGKEENTCEGQPEVLCRESVCSRAAAVSLLLFHWLLFQSVLLFSKSRGCILGFLKPQEFLILF